MKEHGKFTAVLVIGEVTQHLPACLGIELSDFGGDIALNQTEMVNLDWGRTGRADQIIGSRV